MTSPAGTYKTTRKKASMMSLNKEDFRPVCIAVVNTVFKICLMFSLVRIMLLFGCSFLGFLRLSINYRGVVSGSVADVFFVV